MGNIVVSEINPLHVKSDKKRFVQFVFDRYSGDKYWAPELRLAQEEELSPKHPFYKTADAKFFMAQQNGKDVGRIAAFYNHNYNEFHEVNVGFFGFFEAYDGEASKQLLGAAETWLREKSAEKVYGPIQMSTNYKCGLLVDGFDDIPQIMMSYNPKEYLDFIEGSGYQKAKDLYAYQTDLNIEMPEIFQKVMARAEKKSKVTYRHLNPKDWDNEVERVLEVYNDAWEKNWGFVPYTEAEFRHTANDMKQIIDPALTFFVLVDGEVAGFLVGLPDYNQIFHKIPNGKLLPTGIFKLLFGKKSINRFRILTMGVKHKYRKLGLEALMFVKAKEHAPSQYKEVEMSWILEDNIPMTKPLERIGASIYKTYRILEKEI